jgi:hypothetical protein
MEMEMEAERAALSSPAAVGSTVGTEMATPERVAAPETETETPERAAPLERKNAALTAARAASATSATRA